ncbi:transposase [Mycolicibacterium doricum]|uniref:transposase n=1 Tax=Mycolicibacterium doricum TaxID=126673 RepID=UPI0021F2BE90|nr:transposase [Mycolicibacterium doricum]
MSVSRYAGTQVIKVPAAFTSQRCPVCGHVDPKSRESQAVFRCTNCPHGPVHADVNAANRRACGHRLPRNHSACGCCGDVDAGTSRKPRGITAPTRLTG